MLHRKTHVLHPTWNTCRPGIPWRASKERRFTGIHRHGMRHEGWQGRPLQVSQVDPSSGGKGVDHTHRHGRIDIPAPSMTLAEVSAEYPNTSRKAIGRTKALALQATLRDGIAEMSRRITAPDLDPARRASATDASRRGWEITCHTSAASSPLRAAPLAWRRATGSCRIDDLRFLDLRNEGACRLFERGWTIRRRPESPANARDSCGSRTATCAGPATSWPHGTGTRSCRFGKPDDTRSGWRIPSKRNRKGLHLPFRYNIMFPEGPYHRPIRMSGGTHRWEDA